MALSTYLKNALLNHIFRNTTYTSPASVYISLHTGDPGATGANEASGGSYARVTATVAFSAASGGANASNTVLTFPTATADWGTITHFGVWDASSGGNFLWGHAVTLSQAVVSGNTAKFNTGNLTFGL